MQQREWRYYLLSNKMWLIIGCALLGPVLTNVIVWAPFFPAVGTHSDWLGFFGNYSGGILGGIVAFFITTYQLGQERAAASERRFIAQHPYLEKIKIDLFVVKRQFTNANNVFRELEKLEGWNGNPRHARLLIPPLTEQYWSGIESITDVALQVELLKMKDIYTKFQMALRYYIDEEQLSVQKLLQQKEKLEKKKRNPEEELTLRATCAQIVKLESEIRAAIGDKEYYWDTLFKDNYLDKVTKLLERVDKLIHDIVHRP